MYMKNNINNIEKLSILKKINKVIKDVSGISVSNDLKHEEDPNYTENRIKENAKITVSFLILLISSSVICTLGLLQNSAAVIIGGMIISPIMWPLMKVSFGISNGKITYIRYAIFLLVSSIIVGLFGSALITLVSPLKSITTEILSRTNPNLLDIIIAMAGGLIAAVGISRPKISETLSGVAIATSLMPPLCVGGIGLALLDWKIFLSGLFLFFENVIAIIFVATIVFIILLKPASRTVEIKKKGLMIVSGLLVLISIPSMFFLLSYSTELKTYTEIQKVIDENFREISPSIQVSPAKIEIMANNVIDIRFEALLPEDLTISYVEQEKMKSDLELLTKKTVNLEILLQRVISTIKKEQIEFEEKKKLAQSIFSDFINRIDASLSINSFILENNNNEKTIRVVLSGESGVVFTEENRDEIEKSLSEKLNEDILLNIEIVERKTLLAKPKLEEMSIKQRISQLITLKKDEGLEIQNIIVRKIDKKTSLVKEVIINEDGEEQVKEVIIDNPDYIINIDLRVVENYDLDKEIFSFIRNQIEEEFKYKFSFNIFLNETKKISL